MQIKSLETWMRCVAEIYSVSNTYQTDKFQFVGMMIKSEGRQESICQPSKIASEEAKKRDFLKQRKNCDETTV